MVHILAAAASAPGDGYGQNDDRLLLLSEHDVYAVADGTGAYGRLADDLLGGIQAHLARHGRPRSIEDLEAAVRSGEAAVAASVQGDPRRRGAGTTLDIVAFAEGPALLGIHAGDGRIYRVREGGAEQLSVDHTWVQEEVFAGRLQPAETRKPRCVDNATVVVLHVGP
jgi:PPM family protein phosphatase